MRIKLNIQRFATYGSVVIPVEADTSKLEKDLKTVDKMVEEVAKPKNIDINAELEKQFDKLFSKYEKGQIKKQYLPDFTVDESNIKEVIDKVKTAKDEIVEQYDAFEKTRLTAQEIIGPVNNFGKLTQENKDTMKLINKTLEEITLQENMATNNLQMYEDQAKKVLKTEQEITKEKEKQTSTSTSSSKNYVYKANMSAKTDMDISSAMSEGGETSGSGMISKASIVLGIIDKAKNFAGKLLKTVGSILWSIVKIAGAMVGITIGASLLATLGGAFVKAITKILEENQTLIANIKYIVFLVTKMIDNIANAITGKIGGALQGLVNIVYTLIVLFGRLLSMLFHIDVFAGTSAEDFKKWSEETNKASKNLSSGAGSAKEIKKQLAGFDEMNVLSEPSTGGGGAGGGGTGFTMPDLKPIEDIQIPKWLMWLIDNMDWIGGIIGTIAGALIALKLGIDPLLGLAIGSILVGIVNLIIDIIDFIKDPTWENFKSLIDDFLIDLALIIGGIAVITGQWIPGLIAGIMLLVGIIIKNWDYIKELFSKAWGWIKSTFIDPLWNGMKALWEGIKVIFAPFITFFSELFGTVWENIKIMINNIKIIVNWVAGIIKDVFSAVWAKIKEIFGPVVSWFKEKWEQALSAIKKVFGPIVEWISGVWDKIKSKLKEWGAKIAEVIGNAFKSVINGVIGAIESILNKPAKAINGLIDKIKNVPGLGGLTKLKTFSFTRLAKGGIINQPGRGVMVGSSAIGGERGPEGVIPLTDAQMMSKLGEAIGRYVSVNVVNPIYMNGRQIAKEMNKINNEDNFAYNR